MNPPSAEAWVSNKFDDLQWQPQVLTEAGDAGSHVYLKRQKMSKQTFQWMFPAAENFFRDQKKSTSLHLSSNSSFSFKKR